jgi:hypothetical protein
MANAKIQVKPNMQKKQSEFPVEDKIVRTQKECV